MVWRIRWGFRERSGLCGAQGSRTSSCEVVLEERRGGIEEGIFSLWAGWIRLRWFAEFSAGDQGCKTRVESCGEQDACVRRSYSRYSSLVKCVQEPVKVLAMCLTPRFWAVRQETTAQDSGYETLERKRRLQCIECRADG